MHFGEKLSSPTTFSLRHQFWDNKIRTHKLSIIMKKTILILAAMIFLVVSAIPTPVVCTTIEKTVLENQYGSV